MAKKNKIKNCDVKEKILNFKTNSQLTFLFFYCVAEKSNMYLQNYEFTFHYSDFFPSKFIQNFSHNSQL